MKRFPVIFFILAVLFLSSCGREPQPGELPGEYVDPRIVASAQKNDEVNATLGTLKYMLDRRKNNDIVTSMQSILEDDRLIGYKLRFKKSGYHRIYIDLIGEDYEYLPIGLEKDGDSYWWTVDGERYIDYNGNVFNAEEALFVFEESYGGWRFKYDRTQVQKLYCDDSRYLNVSIVKSVYHEDGNLKVVMHDGVVLEYPWQEDFDVMFTDKGERTCVPGHSVALGFTTSGTEDASSIQIDIPDGWDCSLDMLSNTSGTVLLTSPSEAVFPAEIRFTLNDGDKSVTRSAYVLEGTIVTDMALYEAGEKECLVNVNVTSNTLYGVLVPEECGGWLKWSQTYGSNVIVFTVSSNTVKQNRSAHICLVDAASSPIAEFDIVQKGVDAYYCSVTVREFLEGVPDEIDFFNVKGRPTDIGADGSLTISDDTGSVAVVSLSNYSDYASRFTPSTKLVVQGRRSLSGTTPVMADARILYFIDNSAKAHAGWMELPADETWSGLEFFHHPMTINGVATRNYSFYWDYDNLVAPMVAYPLNNGLRSTGSRSDQWGLDPLLPRDKQPVLLSPFSSANCGFNVDRGHQCPSADRYARAANIETFYGTNMTPQMGGFNQSFWVGLEEKVRYWATKCDTLYVVTGCTVNDSLGWAKDNDGKKVTVPGHYFKVVLAYTADESFGHGGYMGAAVLLEHRMYQEVALLPRMSMSIDDLEAATGHDFFANLPSVLGDDAAEAVESENPADVSWWWEYF